MNEPVRRRYLFECLSSDMAERYSVPSDAPYGGVSGEIPPPRGRRHDF